jgi:hypothetical protein
MAKVKLTIMVLQQQQIGLKELMSVLFAESIDESYKLIIILINYTICRYLLVYYIASNAMLDGYYFNFHNFIA